MFLRLILPLLIFSLACSIALPNVSAKSGSEAKVSSKSSDNTKPQQAVDSKYEGYQIDGFATASKLAAQRSHTPAGEDERNFAVFTGIVVIFIVIFFATVVVGKKK